jgi:hypothetical protein
MRVADTPNAAWPYVVLKNIKAAQAGTRNNRRLNFMARYAFKTRWKNQNNEVTSKLLKRIWKLEMSTTSFSNTNIVFLDLFHQ